MISRQDPIKSRLILHYLAKATKKMSDQENARKRLAAQLKQLKKISTNTLQKHLDELERRITETVRIENQILKSQGKDDGFHNELKQKIAVLEEKLGKYIETKEIREKRIKELEDKVNEKEKRKAEVIADIKKSMHKLEQIYEEAKKSKNYSSADLDKIRRRITALKTKLETAEKIN